MSKPTIAFEVDDTKTVDENISAFAAELDSVDAPMAGIIAASLSDLSHELVIDQGALLDALYAATAPSGADLQAVPAAQ